MAEEVRDSGMIKRIIQVIGLIATMAFMVIALMVPFTNGGDNNIINNIKSTVEGLKEAKDLMLISMVCQLIVLALPPLGIVIFGIMAILTIIGGFTTNGNVKYNVGGGLIGMCSPYFLLLLTASLASTDNKGFAFPEYFKSTASTLFLVGIFIYLALGIVADFMGATSTGSFMAPIIKIFAVGLGLAAAYFMFGATNTYVTGGNSTAYSSASMWAIFQIIYAFGSSNFQYVMPCFAFIFYMIAVVAIFSSMGSLFGKGKVKEMVQPIALYFVGIAFNIATVFISIKSQSGSSDMYGMVSICGIVAFVLVIAFAIAGIISRKLDSNN